MVELPQGDITEVRRGDRDALRLLSADMARLSTTGFIRTERKPKDAMPRIGHVLFVEGKPKLAIHEADGITFGLEALLEIEDDATPIETVLAIHEITEREAQRISALHSSAFLHLESGQLGEEGERWWSNLKTRPGSWRRDERLPELEVTVEAPEAVRQKSKAYMNRYEGLERMIHPGDALLLDSNNPGSMFSLAGHLANHGRPVLVIARHDIDALSVEHNIPAAACHWLSAGDHPRALQPSIESVRIAIDAFLWENMRAVVLIEGVEYLAGMNGDNRTIDFIRDVVDGARMNDHVLLVTTDMNAFDLEPRHRLIRCLTPLLSSEIDHWLIEPDLMLDHPLCAPPTEEERTWIELQLKQAIQHSPAMPTPLSDGTGLIGGHEPSTEAERIQATEALSSQMEDWTEAAQTIEEEPVTVPSLEVALEATPLQPNAPTDAPSTEVRPTIDPIAEQEPEIMLAPSPSEAMPAPILSAKGPRRAHTIRRKKRQGTEVSKTPAHVRRLSAAADAPSRTYQFPQTKTAHSTAAISSSLQKYQDRQERAHKAIFESPMRKSKPLKQAAQQPSASERHELPAVNNGPRPIDAVNDRRAHGTHDALSPLMARPGVEAEAQPQHLPREIASKEQSAPTIEASLSVWEREDLERMRNERGD
jgi:hypothetical protein